MIYVVLGMHKSGTTLISQILHKSGINMGEFDETVSYDEGNQYERKESQIINALLLGSLNKHSLDVVSQVAEVSKQSEVADKINNLINALNTKHTNWGFKDPRTCLTYSVWKDFLPEHRIIFVYRHPLEVWQHYQERISKCRICKRMIRGFKALKAWLVYNSCMLVEIKKTNQAYRIIDFNRFLEGMESLKELEVFTNKQIIDCREKELYRLKQNSNWIYFIQKQALRYLFKKNVDEMYYQLNEFQNLNIT